MSCLEVTRKEHLSNMAVNPFHAISEEEIYPSGLNLHGI